MEEVGVDFGCVAFIDAMVVIDDVQVVAVPVAGGTRLPGVARHDPCSRMMARVRLGEEGAQDPLGLVGFVAKRAVPCGLDDLEPPDVVR